MATATTRDPWETTVPERSQNGDYTPCPAGNYPSRIVGLFDIGHHPEERTNDKTKETKNVSVHKIVIVYELAEKQPNGSPYTMAQRLTWSMNEKSNFFALVTNLTGRKFQPNETFNPRTLLGSVVMVNVVNVDGKEGKTYANIGSVSTFPRGLTPPSFTHEPIIWSVSEGTPFAPHTEWLPMVFGKSIAGLVKDSAEAHGFTPDAKPSTPQSQPVTQTLAPEPKTQRAAPPQEIIGLIAKYNLDWPFFDTELKLKQEDMSPRDHATLLPYADSIPF